MTLRNRVTGEMTHYFSSGRGPVEIEMNTFSSNIVSGLETGVDSGSEELVGQATEIGRNGGYLPVPTTEW